MQSLRHSIFRASLVRPTASPAARRTFQSTSRNMVVHNVETKAAWDAAVKEPGVMVVDFFATWCGPCKIIAPEVVKMSDKYTTARFYKVDVDQLPEVAQEYGVRAMPTFLVIKDGEQVKDVVGANPVALIAAVEAHV